MKKVRSISLLLCLSILITAVPGCAYGQETETGSGSVTAEPNGGESDAADGGVIQDQPIEISSNWEDYVGNLDALVYGLIVTQYELCYDVFNAVIDLPDGTSVYGIGYSDFSDYYESDDGYGFSPPVSYGLSGSLRFPRNISTVALRYRT